MNENIAALAELIKKSTNTVFFGGAGVSTESGIPDFRSEAGLYAAKADYGLPPEELLSFRCFSKKPELFFRYYKENLVLSDIRPNDAHIALADMEKHFNLKAIITQNVDGLHQRAGSMNVFELHGTNSRHYCVGCKTEYTLAYTLEKQNCRPDGYVPLCLSCGSIVRPDVVLYGEGLNQDIISSSVEALLQAELLIVGGTSLAVYPAAALLQYFRGSSLVLINKGETYMDTGARLVISDSIGKVLKEALSLLR